MNIEYAKYYHDLFYNMMYIHIIYLIRQEGRKAGRKYVKGEKERKGSAGWMVCVRHSSFTIIKEDRKSVPHYVIITQLTQTEHFIQYDINNIIFNNDIINPLYTNNTSCLTIIFYYLSLI